MAGRRALVTEAITAALRLRREHGVLAGQPVCIFDLVAEVGIDVRLLALPSMEGMFDAETRTIFVCSLRPPGRQAFTTAHELGHYILGHGTHVSEHVEPGLIRSHHPEELAANAFAGALLMPKSAVMAGFSSRGWDASAPTATQIYVVAGAMGVGYTTLINHLRFGITLLNKPTAESLLREGRTLGKLRTQLAGRPVDGHLVVVDEEWEFKFIDVTVGDTLMVPPSSTYAEESFTQISASDSHLLLKATAPGKSILAVGEERLCARIARHDYAGRAVFRHESEDSVD